MLDVSEIEERIYEATLIPDVWPQLLGELALLADAPAGLVMGFPLDDLNAAKLVTSPGFDAVGARYNAEGWGEKNGRFARGVANGSAFEPRFISEEDIYDTAPFDDEPLYRDLLLPAGLGRSIGTVFSHAHGDVVIVTFERRYQDGPVGASVRELLDALRPHFARSSLLAYRLDFGRVTTAVQILEQLGLPAAAVKSDGTVTIAGQMFDAGSATMTTRMRDKIALHDARAQEMLSNALAHIRTSGGGVLSIPLRERGELVRKVLHLVPIKRSAHDLFVAADAMLVVSESSDQPPNRGGVLQALFDLTPREAQVAAAIAQGRTVREIAALHGASHETVRNQLRVVLAKTGCGRQSDLTRLVADLFPSSI